MKEGKRVSERVRGVWRREREKGRDFFSLLLPPKLTAAAAAAAEPPKTAATAAARTAAEAREEPERRADERATNTQLKRREMDGTSGTREQREHHASAMHVTFLAQDLQLERKKKKKRREQKVQRRQQENEGARNPEAATPFPPSTTFQEHTCRATTAAAAAACVRASPVEATVVVGRTKSVETEREKNLLLHCMTCGFERKCMPTHTAFLARDTQAIQGKKSRCVRRACISAGHQLHSLTRSLARLLSDSPFIGICLSVSECFSLSHSLTRFPDCVRAAVLRQK